MTCAADVLRIVADAVGEAIKELEEVPSGHLYAMMLSSGITLDVYETVIEVLVRSE